MQTESQDKSVSMPRRKLGRTGIEISALSLGSWNTYGHLVNKQKDVDRIVDTAYERGIRFFDTANNYADGRAEQMLGAALKSKPRDSLILSSKVYMTTDYQTCGLSQKQIMRGIDTSLSRIGTDYLDIYFCHRYDHNTPLSETIMAMDELVRQGKIRYWGTSTWSAAQIKRACSTAEQLGCALPMVEQPELNLLSQVDYRLNTLPEVHKHQLGVVTYSPLASGLLSGKYHDGIPSGSRLAKIEWLRNSLHPKHYRSQILQLESLAHDQGVTPAQLAIAWTLIQPGVSSVITGATHVDQLSENLGALNIAIGGQMQKRLQQLFAPGPWSKIKRKAHFQFEKLRTH